MAYKNILKSVQSDLKPYVDNMTKSSFVKGISTLLSWIFQIHGRENKRIYIVVLGYLQIIAIIIYIMILYLSICIAQWILFVSLFVSQSSSFSSSIYISQWKLLASFCISQLHCKIQLETNWPLTASCSQRDPCSQGLHNWENDISCWTLEATTLICLK